jgi:hypothetical protein
MVFEKTLVFLNKTICFYGLMTKAQIIMNLKV